MIFYKCIDESDEIVYVDQGFMFNLQGKKIIEVDMGNQDHTAWLNRFYIKVPTPDYFSRKVSYWVIWTDQYYLGDQYYTGKSGQYKEFHKSLVFKALKFRSAEAAKTCLSSLRMQRSNYKNARVKKVTMDCIYQLEDENEKDI